MKLHYLSISTLISDEANAVHVMRMNAALARRGHDVTVHAARGRGDDDEVFRYFGLEPSFRLLRHPADGRAMDRTLLELERRRYPTGLRGLAKLAFDRRTMRPHLMADAPDVVYTRASICLPTIPRGLPFVFEAHTPPTNRPSYLLERRALRRPTLRRLVVISEALRDVYHRLFPWVADRIVVAHDAADDPEPPAQPRADDGFRVGFVGHLYPGRGVELIPAVAAALPESPFDIVGGTESDLARLRAALRSDNVVIHGHQPPARLPEFYTRFDVVIAPYQRRVGVSGGNKEIARFMSPMKIFEYMSWGKPIVSSDLPVLREVLVHDHNALLVPPDDPWAWAAAILRLRDEPDVAARLGDQARTDFLASHTWDARARRVLDGLDA